MALGFEPIENALLAVRENIKSEGIGVLGEKTLHSTLKFYFCPDKNCHEVKFKGFVADICVKRDNNVPLIYEIQTRQTYKLVRKLTAYANDAEIVVVLPMTAKKNIIWRDPDTNEIKSSSKTSRPKGIYHALGEIYALRDFINRPNVRFLVPVIGVTEYRLLDGFGTDRKRRATRVDIVPEEIVSMYGLVSVADYIKLLPENVPEKFTVKELSRLLKLDVKTAGRVILTLSNAGAIKEAGRDGKSKIWQKNLAEKL